MSLKITGKLPSGKHLERLKQSPQYREGAFQNISLTPMKPDDISYWKMTREFFKKHPGTAPSSILPFVKTDLSKLNSTDPVIIWYGHSSYLLRVNGKNFLVDPVFSGNAAPFSFMVKAFPGSNEYTAGDMPVIDYLVLTHDHYDHLDFKTIRKLKKKVRSVFCSLGISAHLKHWGIDGKIITEMDWWQTEELDDNLLLTAAPARHFSGRGLKRGQTLWSSFILKTPVYNIYMGGDSGYDEHFKTIGEKYGPFDLAILESGQYNTMWPLIHMMPEETVQAALDLRAKVLLPVHWGKFKLGMHPWDEPINRIVANIEERERVQDSAHKIKLATPRIGEPLLLNNVGEGKQWWRSLNSPI